MVVAMVQALLILSVPLFSIWLARRVKVFEWLGPVVLCYLLGIAMANLPWVINKKVVKEFTEISIVLALPLLLFSADIRAWFKLATKTMLSFGLMIVAAVTSAFLTYLMMGKKVMASAEIAGMLVGMYSGGTVNTSAIGKALGVSDNVFFLVTTVDLIIGGIYLLFVLSVGQRVLLLFLPPFEPVEATFDEEPAEAGEDKVLFSGLAKIWQLLLALLCCGLVVGGSVGLSLLIHGKIKQLTVFLLITTLGLVASLWRPIRELAWSYEAGDYLLLIFCVAIGCLVDIQKLTQSSDLFLFLGFAACLMFGAILIHFVLAAIFRIDADTTLITSSAGIFGPPFIGPIASALKNRHLLVSGLTMSIAGLAVGTYLGIFLARLLM